MMMEQNRAEVRQHEKTSRSSFVLDISITMNLIVSEETRVNTTLNMAMLKGNGLPRAAPNTG